MYIISAVRRKYPLMCILQVFNAVNAAFLSDEDKEILRKKVDNLFNQVEAKFNISSNL